MDRDIYLLLHNIRSAFNVGSIFRTADAVGVKKIFLSGYTPYPPDPKLDKTALGALDYVDWEYNRDLNFILNKIEKLDIPIYSGEQRKDSVLYTDILYPKRICLALGNEIDGVSDEIIKSSNYIIEIPMHGKKNSLNVSVACGILLYYIKSSEFLL